MNARPSRRYDRPAMELAGADIVRALFDAFARRDADAVVTLLDPEAEIVPQGTARRVERREPYRGYAGAQQYLADVAAVWERLEVEPGDLRVAGNGVVAFGTARGVSGGTEIEVPVIWVFKLRAGRVLSARVVATAAEAEVALARSEA